DAVGVVNAGRAHARVLLGVDDVLHRRRLAASPLLRPVAPPPPAFVEPALPVLAALLAARDARLHTAGATASWILVATPVSEELRQVLLEPRSKLVAERDVLGRVREIHRPNTNIRVRFLGEAAFRWISPSATIKTRCATPCARSSRRKRRAGTCRTWLTTST